MNLKLWHNAIQTFFLQSLRQQILVFWSLWDKMNLLNLTLYFWNVLTVVKILGILRQGQRLR